MPNSRTAKFVFWNLRGITGTLQLFFFFFLTSHKSETLNTESNIKCDRQAETGKFSWKGCAWSKALAQGVEPLSTAARALLSSDSRQRSPAVQAVPQLSPPVGAREVAGSLEGVYGSQDPSRGAEGLSPCWDVSRGSRTLNTYSVLTMQISLL